jgi:serine protease AprX
MSRITINGITLDPTAQARSLSATALVSSSSSDSDYILVQTRHPLTAAERQQLTAAGAEPLEYVPENTYVCRYPGADLGPIQALSFVEWANVYLHAFKIAATLRSPNVLPVPTDLLRLHGTRVGTPAQKPQLVDVVLHRGVDVGAVSSDLAAAAGIEPSQLSQHAKAGKLRVRVTPKRMELLSELDAVRHIEPVVANQLFNNLASNVLRATDFHQQQDLQGESEIVAVADTGFDLGQTNNVHPAFTGRVLKIYPLGRRTGSDPNGHGTHVCGSVLGDGVSSSDGPIRGTAPKAQLVMQSILDEGGELGGIPNNLRDLFAAPYADGARVHSNSWGAPVRSQYTESSHELDDFVWNHRDLVVVVAAGNEGTDRNADGMIDRGSIGSPATAKNCISVGASENARSGFAIVAGAFRAETWGEAWPNDYPVDPIASDRIADDAEGLAAFSSRGPTRDGRIKPDVVAPGTGILSTRSRAPGVSTGWAPSPDAAYHFEGGTSMATPLVSGCAAVLRQFYKRKHNLANPSAALIKATLINTATDLAGQYTPSEAAAIPNFNEGFGRVDLLGISDDNNIFFQVWDEGAALDTGEEKSLDINLPGPAASFRATLVWTDPAGETLQNDLDLIVRTSAGVERHGNVRGNSRGFDRVNNVEQVSMLNVPAGTVTVTVRAFRAALHPQSFALVVRAKR